jgi:hypothetical protein
MEAAPEEELERTQIQDEEPEEEEVHEEDAVPMDEHAGDEHNAAATSTRTHSKAAHARTSTHSAAARNRTHSATASVAMQRVDSTSGRKRAAADPDQPSVFSFFMPCSDVDDVEILPKRSKISSAAASSSSILAVE